MRPEFSVMAIPLLVLVWSAAIWDLNQRRIPNTLVLVGAVLGGTLHLVQLGLSGLLFALAGLASGLAILMPGYLFGTTGAGDVKLMAAIGTFLGPYDALLAGLACIAAGAVIALAFMASAMFSDDSIAPWERYRLMLRTFFATGRPVYVTPTEGEAMGRKFPFAVSIALGTTLFLLWQWPFLGLAS